MKKNYVFLLMLIILVTLMSCATTQIPVDSISEVIEVEGVSGDELFVKANAWMVDVFKSSKSVIQFADKESGLIKGKYVTVIDNVWTGDLEVNAAITIETKDGRVRITFTFVGADSAALRGTSAYSFGKKTLDGSDLESYNRECLGLITVFEKYLNDKSGDEW